ncbi:hypothetical protein AGMMS49990_01230 [Endomicrobiia bacterium]|nr:hypothetical protein AGMMS49990_01230 [Endomicrobiia bacterium]
MKKVILFTSLITLSSFLLSACPRNKKLLERKDSDNGHNVKSESASNVDPNVKSESASNAYPIERESKNAVVMSPADWEKSIRDDIERETYRSNVLLL